jgi:hypothetical protein
MPAQAGIQIFCEAFLDSRFRWNDKLEMRSIADL